MITTLTKSIILLLLACGLLAWSAAAHRKSRSRASLFFAVGFGFLIIVGLVHVFEAKKWLEIMHWGSPHSVGHYLDFSSALLSACFLVAAFIISRTKK